MDNQLVFATNNRHKLEEVSAMLGNRRHILSLKDIQCHEDIPEKGATLEENALIKAQYVYRHYGMNCFADDTGLEVEALDGYPGVYSARYAGEGHDAKANMKKLLSGMAGKENRKARFRTVMALIVDGQEHLFEGIVNGHITTSEHGTEGFGYDPVFVPEGYEQTFAELGNEIKNRISHRAKAVKALADFLNRQSF